MNDILLHHEFGIDDPRVIELEEGVNQILKKHVAESTDGTISVKAILLEILSICKTEEEKHFIAFEFGRGVVKLFGNQDINKTT